ncbi:hypothetical protein [Gordonia crocea]|uniref:hypothetical protein n=1 Tax=Gordonia crocea TaxID=589162 RepID=UPI001E59744D|nr:hypothetical protein [Gordonia crocea]
MYWGLVGHHFGQRRLEGRGEGRRCCLHQRDDLDRQRGAENGGGRRAGELEGEQPQCDGGQAVAGERDQLRAEQVAIVAHAQDRVGHGAPFGVRRIGLPDLPILKGRNGSRQGVGLRGVPVEI